MPVGPRALRRSGWLVALGGSLGLTAVAALAPSLRPAAIVAASVLSVALVLLGIRVNRPRTWQWPVVALMLALWGVADVLVQVRGAGSNLSDILVGVGQAVALVVVLRLTARRSSRAPFATAGGVLDVVVIATVLGLVAAQLVSASAVSSQALSVLMVPTVDVLIVGLLLRFVVSLHLPTGAHLLVLAAAVTAVYDLLGALQGQRLALPGQPEQALGVLCVMLFAVAALHPTMGEVTDPSRRTRSRPESTALLSLLPLVAVPLAMWWVSRGTGALALPSWVLLLAGMLIAALCLLRASQALRLSEHLAEHDPLTDLANRRGLGTAFALSPGTAGLALLLVDVDEFKQVNDTHGHDVGDTLLLRVRDRLVQVAGTDAVVARFGGDEFVVLSRRPDPAALAADVLHSLRAPVDVRGLTLRISASVGISRGEPGDQLPDLLTRADVAMYSAKSAGRDKAVLFRPEMRAEVARRFTLTAQVRLLLGGDDGDDLAVGRLEVHYQPLVRLDTGAAVGSEALVRWQHPQLGLLAPNAFLNVVSSSGLDLALDRAVLGQVLDQLVRWRDQGRMVLPVSLNLTRDSLAHPDLATDVLAALDRVGVPPSWLVLEITEHQELPDGGSAARSLRTLSAAGVRTHLDDYGTGFTSLDYLHRFPVSVLKVDSSLVRAMTGDGPRLVAGIAAMAAALDMDLLAEGVETTGQLEQLLDVGVRYGQGYLFSRPLTAERFGLDVLGDVGAGTGAPRPRPGPPPGYRGSTTGEPVRG